MIEILTGARGFFGSLFFLVVVLESSLLIEEFLRARIEIRKGFSGTNTTILYAAKRHLLCALRLEGSIQRNMAAALSGAFILFATGFLPIWAGAVPLNYSHSIWIYLGARALLPISRLILEWRFNKGRGWPSFLTNAERAVGSISVLVILTLALVEMTGTDSFAQIRNLQREHGALIFRYPLAIVIMFGYIILSLYWSSQSPFSQPVRGEKQDGWSLDDFLPQLRRISWSLFIVDVFCGGSSGVSFLGDISLVVKCVGMTVLATVLGKMSVRLREDQAENFILWRMAPASILVLLVSLLTSGGRF